MTEELKAVREIKCPFYGFHLPLMPRNANLLIDSFGNQCALIQGSYSPCKMEINGEQPSWEECTLYEEHNKKTLITQLNINGLRVFPNGINKNNGLSFSEWYEHRTGKAPI